MKKATGEDQSIRTTIQGDAATYLTVACVQEDLFQVACYSPLRIPEGSRRDIAEALVRDFDDGELRFLDAKSLVAVNMMETYLSAFMLVVYVNEEPGDAIRRVEGG